MASSGIRSGQQGKGKGKGKSGVHLSLDDILSDLANLPRSKPSPFSTSIDELPTSRSESVEGSLAMSQALIDRSNGLLEESIVLESVVQTRLREIDDGLGRVEKELG